MENLLVLGAFLTVTAYLMWVLEHKDNDYGGLI